ncbi:MAG: 50S ribosomal protein L30 [Chloroflexi bacterium]|nr:50S ribosomal protein L30 [Chloroflexota bacterium]
MAKLRITWVKSGIGYAEDQKRTLKALGFHRLNQSVVHADSLSIRGMLSKVKHLVRVEEEKRRRKSDAA